MKSDSFTRRLLPRRRGDSLRMWRSDREPKIPLGQANAGSTGTSGASTTGAIGGEAKTALDSGNMLFRAKAYDRALAQYRRSARLAPTELAPLLGILMVTDVTKNAKLADSTLSRMRELNPAAADSSAAMSHAEILEAHSRAKKARHRARKSRKTAPPRGDCNNTVWDGAPRPTASRYSLCPLGMRVSPR